MSRINYCDYNTSTLPDDDVNDCLDLKGLFGGVKFQRTL